MPAIRPKESRRLWQFGWIRAGLACCAIAGLCGCTTMSNPLSIFAPYRGAQQPEEFHSPPAQDTRYTEPPTYPSHLLKPVYKAKDDNPENFRKSFGPGGPMSGPGG